MTRAMLALVWVLIPLVSFAADPAGAPAPDAKKTADANKGAAPEADKQPPRKSYNRGRTAFQSGDMGTAEARFLAARPAFRLNSGIFASFPASTRPQAGRPSVFRIHHAFLLFSGRRGARLRVRPAGDSLRLQGRLPRHP